MPGVNFTRGSARRIADTVRGFEAQAEPNNNPGRTPGGGLGRMTLWEVTAVQTGPGTVTIKRASNIAFDLNDLSEKTDILYDPDKTPSVGDTGLLIRLGNGSLFFFSRDIVARAVELYTVSGVAGVSPDNPDTHYTAAIASKDSVGSDEFHAVMKLTPFAPAVGDVRNFAVFTGLLAEIDMVTNIPGAGAAAVAEISLNMSSLRYDFDIDTVTFNDLTTTGPGVFLNRRISGTRANGNAALGGACDGHDVSPLAGYGFAGSDVFTRDVYGIMFSWSIGDLHETSRAFLSMEIGTDGYLIRWE